MDELISKRAVIEAIEKARANVGHNLERSIGKSIIEILDDVGRDVDRLPSALGTNLAEVGTDAISRQAAITAIQNAYCDTEGGEYKCAVWKNVGLTEALHIMQDLPSAQPEQRWIPCSAGLPKTNDPVNVTYVNHNPGNYYAEVKDKPYTATAHFHNGQWYWYSCTTQDLLDEYGTWIPDLIDKDVEITAWCELPEPYKGGDGMNIEQEKMIVEALPSLYPLQEYEEKAIWAVIDALSTAHAEPKKGKWILDRSGAYCCSECMEPCAGYVMMKPRDKYCKMCGAKMEVTT